MLAFQHFLELRLFFKFLVLAILELFLLKFVLAEAAVVAVASLSDPHLLAYGQALLDEVVLYLLEGLFDSDV